MFLATLIVLLGADPYAAVPEPQFAADPFAALPEPKFEKAAAEAEVPEWRWETIPGVGPGWVHKSVIVTPRQTVEVSAAVPFERPRPAPAGWGSTRTTSATAAAPASTSLADTFLRVGIRTRVRGAGTRGSTGGDGCVGDG